MILTDWQGFSGKRDSRLSLFSNHVTSRRSLVVVGIKTALPVSWTSPVVVPVNLTTIGLFTAEIGQCHSCP